MTEKLFQYIWQYQHFNYKKLETTTHTPLQIISPGSLNTNQGPDFLNAKIKIGDTTWAGSVELHILSSDWHAHRHSEDEHYRNVILHVVWKHNVRDEFPFPTIELYQRVSHVLLSRYNELMHAKQFIRCEKHFCRVEKIIVTSWLQRMLVERLQDKAGIVQDYLEQNNFNWEETFWWLIARNFGSRLNGDSFEKIARSIPLRIIAKHKQQVIQIEALLLGQAGLLEEEFTDDYPAMLKKEFHFLRKKYGLKKNFIPVYFLRMRPANFPTVRLAQLASLLSSSVHLFSRIKDEPDIEKLHDLFVVTANDYWHYHYRLGEATTYKQKTLGTQMYHNIMINTIIPILYAYGYYHNNEKYQHKALEWLGKIKPERNCITEGYEELGIINRSAFDSQGLIQLKNKYCDMKRCLQCGIGNAILKG